MKKILLNLRLVIFLGALLFVLILGQSILEYRSGRKAVLDLMNNQARALILSVAKASEKGLVAYEIQQDKIAAHLYTIVQMVDRLDHITRLDSKQLSKIGEENNLLYLIVYNPRGVQEKSFAVEGVSGDGAEFNILISDVLSMKNKRPPLRFLKYGVNGQGSYAIGIKRANGGAIVAGIDASELLTLRKTFGAGSVIDDISQSPGVKYAGIFKSGILVAASSNFIPDSLDRWYSPKNPLSDDAMTRIRRSGNAVEAFEAMAPFTVAGDQFGEIVIGIDSGYLNLLTAKMRRDILWRSILFMIVALVVAAGVILRQNYRLLTGQYNEIQHDVQRLEADKALSAKLVAMGELAGGVAHEIRNPLNAIRVIIQRLEREFIPQKDEAEYKELTAVIRKETDKINESVKNFLTLARPPVLHKTLADLNHSIQEIVALFQPRAETKGCSLKIDLGDLPSMQFDTELMHQAILNLLENALAAIGSNGKIEIKTFHRDNSCFIEISDNGFGIQNDEKPRVFDLYYTTKPTGTGMGLPMVLRIIKEHGGKIDLLDSPSGGALFRLEIPVEQ